MYKPVYYSDRIFVFEYKGRNIIYAPVDQKIMEVDGGILSSLGEATSDSEVNDVLSLNGRDRIGKENPPIIKEYVSKGKYDGLTILSTNSCNISCTYCYAIDAQKNPSFIDRDMYGKILNFFFSNIDESSSKLSLGLHGYGEVSLNPKIIFDLVDDFKRRSAVIGKGYNLQITTNGTFRREFCDYLIDNNFYINLSLDGTPEINDKNRITKRGSGSYFMIEPNLERILSSEISDNLMIRATITPDIIDTMEETVSYYGGMGVKYIQFEPVYMRSGQEQDRVSHRALWERFAENYLSCIKIANVSGVKLYHGPINFGLNNTFCSHDGKLLIDHKGRISGCIEAGEGAGLDQFVYGRLGEKEEVFFDDKSFKKMNTRTVNNFPECQSCFIKYHCGGNCFASRDSGNWSDGKLEDVCDAERKIFSNILINMLDGKGDSSIVDFPVDRVL